MVNQGGDRDIKTAKNLVDMSEQENAPFITLETDITLQDNQPWTLCWNAKMAISQNDARYRKYYQHEIKYKDKT